MRYLLRLLTRLADFLLTATLALLVILAAVETLAWGFFEVSWPQVAEINGLLLVFFGVLGAAQGVRKKRHLGVELVTRRLPPTGRRAVERVVLVLVALFGLLLAYYSFDLAGTVRNTLPATGLSAAWQYVPAALGGLLIARFAAGQLLPSKRPATRRRDG